MGKLRIKENEGKNWESERSHPSVYKETKLQGSQLVTLGRKTGLLLFPFLIPDSYLFLFLFSFLRSNGRKVVHIVGHVM